MKRYKHADDLYIAKNYLMMTDEEMGNAIGHSRSSIRKKRSLLGLSRAFYHTKGAKHKVPLSTKAKAYELYTSGIGVVEIAKIVGHNRQGVGRWIKSIKGWSGGEYQVITIQSKI